MCVTTCLLLQWEPKHVSYNFDVRKGPISIEYFKGGETNICYNALDRWVLGSRKVEQDLGQGRLTWG